MTENEKALTKEVERLKDLIDRAIQESQLIEMGGVIKIAVPYWFINEVRNYQKNEFVRMTNNAKLTSPPLDGL